ncbi:peptide ABC transporter substrate-binding protein [Cohnella pontilimi]|uniref:Peptide ABC transporter substrate-binding protein n=1 Tax=Cohnella pontilimi TaxID=2564100 RepID=A0A4U0FEX1_9BACL|nr:peptide ABC transporter substrate-binding protein [Cohnella pontilimi]TJY42894.1 peptide ABC transporter substrate-binding protein [Cohnella pontilimi]
MVSPKKLSLTLLASLLVFVLILSACTSSKNNDSNSSPTSEPSNSPTSSSSPSASATSDNNLAADQVFRLNLHSEPPTLDPGMAQDNVSGTVLNAIMEGLTTVDENGKVGSGMAKEWKISDDSLTYTFTLRDDIKWNTGEPVTAHDFEFSWKRVLDPAKQTPAPYAYQLYYLKNAEGYNTKKITDVNQVGVKAQDDKTLVVTLAQPTAYFLTLCSFYTYYPVNKAVVEKNPDFDKEASTMTTNGPFLLAEWKHNESITLKRNPDYYGANEVKLNEVRLSMVNDANTEISMYDTNELDWAGRPVGTIPTDMIPSLKANPEANLQIKGIASTYYYLFNLTKPPFNNKKIRQAFAMAVNRQALIDNVTHGEQKPAFGFVPYGINGADKQFREEVQDNYFTEDLEKAKQLLAEGMAEAKLTKLPKFELIHNENEGHKKIATAIADMWKKNLGVDVTVQSQEWGVFLTNRTNKNYQIARAGWGADYNDPNTFLDMFMTGGGNNDAGYANPEYDKLIKEAGSTIDQKVRMQALANAEKMLIDDMAILPLYYYTGIWMQKPYVKNVFIDYSGEIHFNKGYIEAH